MKEKIRKTDQEWRELLSPEQYRICRQKGTEPAFSGEFWKTKEAGTYSCVCCGCDLFSSEDKFDSGSGWPSFTSAVSEESVSLNNDYSHFMRRVEVTCSVCEAHLGHLFEDGPEPTGKRFCINSRALRFSQKS